MKVGLIINPYAGIGGSLGLKGSDGEEIRNKALALGAELKANDRTKIALEQVLPLKDNFTFVTAPHLMGADLLEQLGFDYEIIDYSIEKMTSAEDTIRFAKAMLDKDIDVLLFSGGDGTARDIYDAVGNHVITIGIPAGVKIHSAVYAHNPLKAGKLLSLYSQNKDLLIKEQEVMDLDEDAYRAGNVNAKLYGYLKVPFEKEFVQNRKSASGTSEEASVEGIPQGIIDDMEANVYYLIGSGTTTRRIMELLGLPNTLLGVDIIKNKELIASDVSSTKILEVINDRLAKIIITLIGGQGHIFGRGNQQFSTQVIEKIGKENILIIATRDKLNTIFGSPMLIDTGSPEMDEYLSGYYKVRCGYDEYIPYRASS